MYMRVFYMWFKQGKSLSDKWAEEFSAESGVNTEADFWEKLQKQWQDMAK